MVQNPFPPPLILTIFISDDVIRPINTLPCVCVMAEACDPAFQQQLLATLEPLCLDSSNKVKCVQAASVLQRLHTHHTHHSDLYFPKHSFILDHLDCSQQHVYTL